MNINELLIKREFKLSVWKVVILSIIIPTLLIAEWRYIDYESSVYIIVLLCWFYFFITLMALFTKVNLWKSVHRYRFLSWYYISFSIIQMSVFLGIACLAHLLFQNFNIAVIAFTLFIAEMMNLTMIYKFSLHFIAVDVDCILIVKRKIYIIAPENVDQIYYRNDIMIFQLKNEKTVFINFLEIYRADEVRQKLNEWIEQKQLNIINE